MDSFTVTKSGCCAAIASRLAAISSSVRKQPIEPVTGNSSSGQPRFERSRTRAARSASTTSMPAPVARAIACSEALSMVRITNAPPCFSTTAWSSKSPAAARSATSARASPSAALSRTSAWRSAVWAAGCPAVCARTGDARTRARRARSMRRIGSECVRLEGRARSG